jgi:hypothetical protein
MPQNNPQTQRNQKLKNKIKESCIPIKKGKKLIQRYVRFYNDDYLLGPNKR